jgi:hypothetical protein
MYKFTIDTNIQLTLYKALRFSEGPWKIVKIFFITGIKNVSFALLNGWNVTKTIVLTTHEREWMDPALLSVSCELGLNLALAPSSL